MDAANNPFRVSRVKPGAVPYQFPDSMVQPALVASRSDRVCIDANVGMPGRRMVGADRINPTNEDRPWTDLLASLRSCQVGAIVGPHGSGKSTLVHTWVKKLREEFDQVHQIRMHDRRHYSVAAGRDESGRQGLGGDESDRGDFRLPSEQRQGQMRKMSRAGELVERVCGDSLVIIDGAEQLSMMKWLRLLWIIRKRALHLLVTCHGRLLGSNVIHRTHVSADVVQILTQQLIANADYEAKSIVGDYLRNNDLSRVENLRDLWFDLYDQVQQMTKSPLDIDRKPIGKPLNRAAL